MLSRTTAAPTATIQSMTLELIQSDQEVWHRTDRDACPAAGHVVMEGDYPKTEVSAEREATSLDGSLCADCFPDLK